MQSRTAARKSGGAAVLRSGIITLLVAASFGLGYISGRGSSPSTGGALRGESCPPPEPCRCECPQKDRRLAENAGKPVSLPFSFNKKSSHLDPQPAAAVAAPVAQEPAPPAEAAPQTAPEAAAPFAAAAPEAPKSEQPAAAADGLAKLAFGKKLMKMFGAAEAATGDAAAAPALAAVAPAAAPAAASAPLPAPSADRPTVSSVDDLCLLPAPYRPPIGPWWWADGSSRKVLEVPFLLPGADIKQSKLKAYSTLYPGSKTSLVGNDVWELVGKLDYDPHALTVLRSLLRPGGGAFIDIGSWIGVTTLYGAMLADRVLAVEPDPRAFEEAWANLRLNPAQASKVHLYRHCISDRPELRTIQTVVGSTATHLGLEETGAVMSSYQVPCTPLEQLANDHGLNAGNVQLVRLDAAPGTELHLAPELQVWASKVPQGQPKPALWLTLHAHTWQDKTLGHHTLMPIVRAYKHAYNGDLTPLDLAFAERRGEGPCPRIHGACNVLLTDTPFVRT